MTTYSTNDELILDDGKQLDNLLSSDLSSAERDIAKDASRLKAYNYINDNFLRGKTAIPATHIPLLKQIEIDLVVSDVMAGSFSMEMSNVSDWSEKYKERAIQYLKELKFGASAESAVTDDQNIGNGTVSAITVKDKFTMNEQWTLTAQNATTFSVYGSISGRLRDLVVGDQYPGRDWSHPVSDYGLYLSKGLKYEEFPFSLLITVGNTAFAQWDRFSFNTYASSYFRQIDGEIIRA